MQLIKEAVKRDLFDTPKAVEQAMKAWADSPEIQQHALLVKRWAGKVGSLLDLGCGVGRQASLMKFDAYLGIDQSEAMVSRARAVYANRPEMSFVAGNIFGPALSKVEHEVAICLDVLQHQIDPCKSFHRLLEVWHADEWIVSFLLGAQHEELLVTTVCGFKEYLTMLDKMDLLHLHMHRIPPNDLAWVFAHFKRKES